MRQLKFLALVFVFVFSSHLKAQIFINTGNPDLEKHMKETPNAVMWDGGPNIPVPANIPAEQKQTPDSSHATTTATTPVTKPAKRTPGLHYEPVPPMNNTPVGNNGTAAPAMSAKEPTPDYPPNAVPGHCYARCMAPDQFDLKEEQVLDKPASVQVEHVPATYETVMEQVVAVPESRRIITIPAQYEDRTENKMVAPATQKWMKVSSSKNCFSPNPKDCEVWSLVDVPAVYKQVTTKVEVVPASQREEVIPAVMKQVARKKIVKPAEDIKTEIPASYKSVIRKTVIRKGGYYEWKEILCEQLVTENKINAIQQALIREGYDPGMVDNQMGEQTKQAIIKFQQDKGLPVGNLNMETLKALGVQ